MISFLLNATYNSQQKSKTIHIVQNKYIDCIYNNIKQ